MPKFGQHFLKSRSALSLMSRSLEMQEGDAVIEIGSGHGELTDQLKTEASALKNFRIIAIERDAKLAAFLRERFADEPRVEIVEGDALKKITSLVSAIAPSPYKITGNIPYYITGKLLRIIGELRHKPTISTFTVQKEVAERIVAEPPHANRLSASVAFWAEAKIIKRVPRADFNPPPKIDSAIIKFLTMPLDAGISEGKFYLAVRAIFSQPRKTILNNLAAHSALEKEELAKDLEKIEIPPDARPHDLSIGAIARIARNIAVGRK